MRRIICGLLFLVIACTPLASAKTKGFSKHQTKNKYLGKLKHKKGPSSHWGSSRRKR
jgi:hypothetical protein